MKDRTLIRISLAVCLAGLAACSQKIPDGPDYRIIVAGQAMVKDRLRDPSSASFSDVTVSPDDVVCGLVNAKNGFGGMTGNQRFIAGGLAVLEDDLSPSDFDALWISLC